MNNTNTETFSAKIELIGINPYVFIPENVLQHIFVQARKDKGKIPVKMAIDDHQFIQTLVKYCGHWRLYLNTPMRKAAKKEVGDTAIFKIAFDPDKRVVLPHPQFVKALHENLKAKEVFDGLRPSLQLEIVRYLSFLKTEQSLNRNIIRAIEFLLGQGEFIGRSKP